MNIALLWFVSVGADESALVFMTATSVQFKWTQTHHLKEDTK